MSRWVVAQSVGLKGQQGEAPDGPADRIAKYIPGEIVSAFTLLFGGLVMLNPAPPQAQWASLGLIALFLVVTIIYVATRTPQGPVRSAHLIVTPISFLAWAYPISSSLLGAWFVGLASFAGQAVAIALSLIVVPRES